LLQYCRIIEIDFSERTPLGLHRAVEGICLLAGYISEARFRKSVSHCAQTGVFRSPIATPFLWWSPTNLVPCNNPCDAPNYRSAACRQSGGVTGWGTSLTNGEETEPKEEEPTKLAEWKWRDGRARTITLLSVSDAQVVYVPPKKNAAQISQHLQKYKGHQSIFSYASEDVFLHHFGYVKEWKDVEGHLVQILRTLKLEGDEQSDA
jgi:hypothetical protein